MGDNIAAADELWERVKTVGLKNLECQEVVSATIRGRTLLHRAVVDADVRSDAAFLRELMALMPESVTMRQHTDGRAPLHLCLSAVACEVILSSSTHSKEDLCSEKDFKDRLPLHAACANHQGKLSTVENLRLIETLVVAYPHACSFKDKNKDGSLPLHYAIESRQSPEAIACLLDVNPLAAATSDRASKSGRSQARSATALDVVERMHAAPSEGLSLPLHQAMLHLANDICWHSVVLIARAYPGAVSVACRETGVLPLARALSLCAPATVISCFLDIHPAALLTRFQTRGAYASDSAYLPLTSPLLTAIENCSNIGDDTDASMEAQSIVKLIINTFPNSLFDFTNGEFPIEAMLRLRQWSIINFSLVRYLDLVEGMSSPSPPQSQTPLSPMMRQETDLVVSCLKLVAPLHTLYLALKCCPGTLREPRPESLQLPLHIAVSSVCSADTVTLLMELYDEAALRHDFWGNLPIHVAVQRSSKGTIAALLRMCPSCATALDASGRRAIDLIMQSEFSRVPTNSFIWRELLSASPESAACSVGARPSSPSLSPSRKMRAENLPLFQALQLGLPFECMLEILLHSLPVLHASRLPNPHYCGQLHDILSEPFTDPADEGKSTLYTRLVEHALDDLDITHTLAYSKHPRTGQTALDCCSLRFRELLLERMFLFSRYKRAVREQEHRSNIGQFVSPPSSPTAVAGAGHRAASKTRTKKKSYKQLFKATDGSLVWSLLCVDVELLDSPPRRVGLLCFESYGLYLIERLQLDMVPPLLLRTHAVTRDPGTRRSTELQLLERLVGEGSDRVSHVIVLNVQDERELEDVLHPVVMRLQSGDIGDLRQGTAVSPCITPRITPQSADPVVPVVPLLAPSPSVNNQDSPRVKLPSCPLNENLSTFSLIERLWLLPKKPCESPQKNTLSGSPSLRKGKWKPQPGRFLSLMLCRSSETTTSTVGLAFFESTADLHRGIESLQQLVERHVSIDHSCAMQQEVIQNLVGHVGVNICGLLVLRIGDMIELALAAERLLAATEYD